MKCETNRLQSNLLQQNVYVRSLKDSDPVVGCKSSSTYVTLNEVVTDEGVRQSFEEVPYPITPESVASYVPACDYKTDPVASMSLKSSGVNLGDITSLQDVSRLDSEQAAALYAQLSERFAQKPVVNSVKENNESEVIDNG